MIPTETKRASGSQGGVEMSPEGVEMSQEGVEMSQKDPRDDLGGETARLIELDAGYVIGETGNLLVGSQRNPSAKAHPCQRMVSADIVMSKKLSTFKTALLLIIASIWTATEMI